MSNNIDDIFKEGLGSMEFARKEQLWQQVEKQLDKPTASASKKQLAYLLLLVCFVVSVAFFAYHFTNSKTNTATASTHTPIEHSTALTASTHLDNTASAETFDKSLAQQKDNTAANHLNQTTKQPAIAKGKTAIHIQQAGVSGDDDITPVATVATHNTTRYTNRAVAFNGKAKTTVQQAGACIGEEDGTEGETIQEKNNAVFAPLPYPNSLKITTSIASVALAPVAVPAKIQLPAAGRKLYFDIVAGSDVFNLAKGAGYYAGLKLNRSFSKGMSLSLGVNYSMSHLSESYRLFNKPTQQRAADAEISKMVMLRFPIMIEQRINKTNFTVVAGLTPVYILNAAIYNLPPAFSGNPDNYRKFTINDIRRLNALFSAGIRYNILPKLAVDLSGSYGLTEMVKNSYINQSSVNGNFKNAQVGLVYSLW